MKKSLRFLCVSFLLLVAMNSNNVSAESICSSHVSDCNLCSVSAEKNGATRNIICSLFGHKLDEGKYHITIVNSIIY